MLVLMLDSDEHTFPCSLHRLTLMESLEQGRPSTGTKPKSVPLRFSSIATTLFPIPLIDNRNYLRFYTTITAEAKGA